MPCTSEEEAAAALQALRSKYWDARHNVYAYSLRGGLARFSDDGEPHGTAGKPVMDVLSGSGLTDLLVVVTRYFGGVLLGTGGLVRAYSTAARDALAAAEAVWMRPSVGLSVVCPYSDHQRLTRLIEQHAGSISDTLFTDSVTVLFSLDEQSLPLFETSLRDVFSGRLTLSETGRTYAPFPCEKKEDISTI